MAARIAERHITGCATEELKTGEFQPEYAGKLGFYLSAIDGTMRTPIDMIYGEPVRSFAERVVVIWSKSNFCLDTALSRRRNDILVRSRKLSSL